MINKLFSRFLKINLLIVAVFLIAPLLILVLKGMNYIIPSLKSEEVLFALKLSFKTSLISTLISVIISIFTGYALFKYPVKQRYIIENLLYTPMSLPHLVSGIALLYLFGRNGIGNILYNLFGIDFVFTSAGIILAQVFVNLPFSIKIILTSLEEINTRMIFTSRTLGCNEVQSFMYITLPSLKRGILSNTIMTWSRALGEFGAVMMVAGTTRMKTEVLPTAIYLNMATGDLDLAIGISSILIIISIICMITFNFLLSPTRR